MKTFRLLMLFSLTLVISSCNSDAISENSSTTSLESSSVGHQSTLTDSTSQNSISPVLEPLKVYIQVSGRTPQEMRQSEDGEIKVFTITLNLNVGEQISIFDNDNVFYNNYNNDFDGTAKISGEYTFTLNISKDTAFVDVDAPQPINPTPRDTKVMVYYTNSERWNNVYVYMWNYKTQTPKEAWPGTKLSISGYSDYGEDQYSIEIDYSKYDRVIFNDGQNRQTEDLIVNYATSGYYGKDGVFTMNATSYGKVEYFTLEDSKNLQYTKSKTKKISVYTPSTYTNTKKYGVLYMFDSQNLYAAATGARPTSDSYGSWSVDVAISNLVERGEDGIIIVAIDNSDGYRDSELTMSQSFGELTSLADNANFYNGKLDDLGNFMKETVMPFIQEKYSVDSRCEHTGIAGSSSGGLAAYYLGLRDNNIYGYIGAFSPANALFTSSAWKRFYQSKDFSAQKTDIYLYCGNGDNLEKMLLPATKEIAIDLKQLGFSENNIVENYYEKGSHNESYWRIAFLEFISKMIK